MNSNSLIKDEDDNETDGDRFKRVFGLALTDYGEKITHILRRHNFPTSAPERFNLIVNQYWAELYTHQKFFGVGKERALKDKSRATLKSARTAALRILEAFESASNNPFASSAIINELDSVFPNLSEDARIEAFNEWLEKTSKLFAAMARAEKKPKHVNSLPQRARGQRDIPPRDDAIHRLFRLAKEFGGARNNPTYKLIADLLNIIDEDSERTTFEAVRGHLNQLNDDALDLTPEVLRDFCRQFGKEYGAVSAREKCAKTGAIHNQ